MPDKIDTGQPGIKPPGLFPQPALRRRRRDRTGELIDDDPRPHPAFIPSPYTAPALRRKPVVYRSDFEAALLEIEDLFEAYGDGTVNAAFQSAVTRRRAGR